MNATASVLIFFWLYIYLDRLLPPLYRRIFNFFPLMFIRIDGTPDYCSLPIPNCTKERKKPELGEEWRYF